MNTDDDASRLSTTARFFGNLHGRLTAEQSSTSTSLLQELTSAQRQFEQRFSCIVCLEAKLHMVYGSCQHRICADCIYVESNRKPEMAKCPICAMNNSFPLHRPDIPEDNIELQKVIGVKSCPFAPCNFETWEWDMDDHLLECEHRKKSNPVKAKQGANSSQKHRMSADDGSPKSKVRRRDRLVLPNSREHLVLPICRGFRTLQGGSPFSQQRRDSGLDWFSCLFEPEPGNDSTSQ